MVTVRITRDGDDLAFIDGGRRAQCRSSGRSGSRRGWSTATAVLYARDGSVVGREGGILDTIDGFADAAGFHVCKVGLRTYS